MDGSDRTPQGGGADEPTPRAEGEPAAAAEVVIDAGVESGEGGEAVGGKRGAGGRGGKGRGGKAGGRPGRKIRRRAGGGGRGRRAGGAEGGASGDDEANALAPVTVEPAETSDARLPARRRARRDKAIARRRGRRAQTVDVEAAPATPVMSFDPGSEVARRSRRRSLRRRLGLWFSFLLVVAAPTGLAGWYLHEKAVDQYASDVAFAVRSLDGAMPSPMMDLFGTSADSTTGDSQMLFEYIQSQPMVAAIDAKLDLRTLWNPEHADWLFRLGEDRTIEDMVFYWNLAVSVAYDTAGGILYVQTKAFDPEDARRIAQAVLDESGVLINRLSEKAREDAVAYAREDLAEAEERVRSARVSLQNFRASQGTADISGDITQEMTLIAGLRTARAQLVSDFDSRAGKLDDDSPVLAALRRQITSLDEQIVEAEARIADAGGGVASTAPASTRSTLAVAAGEQERLQVELELATGMYTSTQAALEAARADARRAQRYLATHISPTLAEEAEYPQRAMWTIGIFAISLILWAIMLLIGSSIRDRN